MTNLSEHVMSLSGPDREVDAEIAVFLKHGCRANLADDLEYLSMPNKHDPGPGVAPGHYWFHCRSGMSLRSAPNYTASIDDAMTLVPETWAVGSLDWWPERRMSGVTLFEVKHFEGDGYSRVGYDAACCKKAVSSAATPALALCAAALIAREASNAE